MQTVIQCAPNFSEGRDEATLSALREAARGAGAILADFSADPDHNRCVATLLGDPEGLEGAALRMAQVAVERIDLTRHAGQHPFLGALDVLPFIPVRHATMEDCDSLARRVGKRLAGDLRLPVYLYAHSASDASRAALPILRRGGFSALSEKLKALAPDYGPDSPHPTAGVAVVGARGPLLAYNVDLETRDLALARRIAGTIREANGGIPGVRALGLSLESAGCVQVSVNITDPEAATLATVYRAVSAMAAGAGVRVRGSELIGGIALPYAVSALNEALGAEVHLAQVLDAWLPPILGGDAGEAGP